MSLLHDRKGLNDEISALRTQERIKAGYLLKQVVEEGRTQEWRQQHLLGPSFSWLWFMNRITYNKFYDL